MRRVFILGGGQLQLDLILEAKKMFFYTIVLDKDSNCPAKKWCDEFLQIDFTDKEEVLQKAKEYSIDMILTSAKESANLSACYVGEKLGLNTNSYQTALNTTDKSLMKKILIDNNIKTAPYTHLTSKNLKEWDTFPYLIKPADNSAGRGVSYGISQEGLKCSYDKAKKYSKGKKVLIEQYIDGTQYSVETISSHKEHQILAINEEQINKSPIIIEKSHSIPANISPELQEEIEQLTFKLLDIFDIHYGAAHIEFKVTDKGEIYVIELASRTGAAKSELINFAYGTSYSQLLILASLDALENIRHTLRKSITCKFIIDYETYKEYQQLKEEKRYLLFEPMQISKVDKDFQAYHLGESKGYYFILNKERR